MMAPTSLHEATIVATEFSYLRDCWLYAMSNGTIIEGKLGDARVPAGLPFNARTQWGANQVFRLQATKEHMT